MPQKHCAVVDKTFAKKWLKLTKDHSASNLSIKTTHGRIENCFLFTDGLYLEGQFQRLTTYIHANSPLSHCYAPAPNCPSMSQIGGVSARLIEGAVIGRPSIRYIL